MTDKKNYLGRKLVAVGFFFVGKTFSYPDLTSIENGLKCSGICMTMYQRSFSNLVATHCAFRHLMLQCHEWIVCIWQVLGKKKEQQQLNDPWKQKAC